MKKRTSLFITLSLVAILTLFSFSNIGFAATDWEEAARKSAEQSPIQTPEKVFEILSKVVRYVYTVFFIVAVLLVLIAAFNFLFSQGEPAKVASARKQITWAAVAIAIALIASASAQIIKNFLEQ